MNKLLKITPLALTKLKNIKIAHNSSAIRFFVKGGGCNGFNYCLEPTNNKAEKFDEVLKIDDLELQICSSSMMHLLGTEIDWTEDIMGASFKFNNPNAISKCGCGTSFST